MKTILGQASLSSHLNVLACFCLIGLSTQAYARQAPAAQLVEVKRIWDQAPHNAFTDLIRFKDHFYCVFREGAAHVSPDGSLRVIRSVDGNTWQSTALLSSPTADLRDAKLTITPTGQLMLCGAGALHDRSEVSHQSFAWFSDDGEKWGEAIPIGEPNNWLWRVTWNQDTAYGVGYSVGKDQYTRLYASQDGRDFTPIVDRLIEGGYPNESSIVFAADTAYCLLRRDGEPTSGLIGISTAPYTQWEWKDLGVRIGGPHLLQLDDGRLLAAVRLYDSKVRTSLCWIDPENGRLTEFLELPSGGDTSYAGMTMHDDFLWVSYYSSHESKTSIYLAKVQLGDNLHSDQVTK